MLGLTPSIAAAAFVRIALVFAVPIAGNLADRGAAFNGRKQRCISVPSLQREESRAGRRTARAAERRSHPAPARR
ncbi:MAG: hypothetical protein KGJ43_03770 [Acidobacteriota bacterium]|nr:hypothetical protein [Acidobacteriota bacterium]